MGVRVEGGQARYQTILPTNDQLRFTRNSSHTYVNTVILLLYLVWILVENPFQVRFDRRVAGAAAAVDDDRPASLGLLRRFRAGSGAVRVAVASVAVVLGLLGQVLHLFGLAVQRLEQVADADLARRVRHVQVRAHRLRVVVGEPRVYVVDQSGAARSRLGRGRLGDGRRPVVLVLFGHRQQVVALLGLGGQRREQLVQIHRVPAVHHRAARLAVVVVVHRRRGARRRITTGRRTAYGVERVVKRRVGTRFHGVRHVAKSVSSGTRGHRFRNTTAAAFDRPVFLFLLFPPNGAAHTCCFSFFGR